MLPGETIASGAPATCPNCKTEAVPGVYSSAAGYYFGTYCECGPYTRETIYFATREEAVRVWKDDELLLEALRSTDYNPGR
jgi:hypothetical protein